MNLFNKKYTDEIENLRNSLAFAVSLPYLSKVISIERQDIGTKYEHTVLTEKHRHCNENHVETIYYISRQQHNKLVEKYELLEKE